MWSSPPTTSWCWADPRGTATLRTRLLAPLGPAGTSLPSTSEVNLPAPYAHGYLYGGTSCALVDKPYPAGLQAAARSAKLKPVDHTHQNPSYATAADLSLPTV